MTISNIYYIYVIQYQRLCPDGNDKSCVVILFDVIKIY